MLSNCLNSAGTGIQRMLPSLGQCQLGLEVGSLSTFFSMEHPELGQVSATLTGYEEDENARVVRWDVRMPDAHLLIEEREHEGCRKLAITALEESRLMDAVLRFVLPLQFVRAVWLNEEPIAWAKRNFYHQRENAIARVELTDGTRWTFEVNVAGEGLPLGLKQLTYLRDEPTQWILHARVRANEPQHYSLRGCTRLYNKPLPGWVQRIWAALPWLAKGTLYIRERVSQRIPFQTNGAVTLAKGQSFEFSVKWNKES